MGVTYAQMLYDLGLDTVEKISKADPIDLHAMINQRIKEHNIFKGGIGMLFQVPAHFFSGLAARDAGRVNRSISAGCFWMRMNLSC